MHSTIPGYLSSIYVQILDNPPYYILCTSPTTVARLIYDQTSSNSRNYTAQGVGNNSCCKTLPISADDDDERAKGDAPLLKAQKKGPIPIKQGEGKDQNLVNLPIL